MMRLPRPASEAASELALSGSFEKTPANGLYFYIGLILLTVLAAGVGYGWLPALGVHAFAGLLSAERLIGLSALLAGALCYAAGVRFCFRKPAWFLFAYLGLLPWFTWIVRQLMEAGVNFPQTACLAVVFCLPTVLLVRRHWRPMIAQVGFLRGYLLFWALTAAYFLFFDHPVYDHTAAVGKQSISVHYLTTMTLNLSALFLAAYVAYRAESPQRLVKDLRLVVLGMSLALSVFALICYPLQLYIVSVEDVMRMTLIFSHPNQFAMYQVFLMTFLTGMYFYDAEAGRDAGLRKWILAALLLGFVTLMMTVCKNAIFSMMAATLVMLFLNAQSAARRKNLLLFVLLAGVLLALVVVGMQAFLGVNIFEKFLSRLENTSSLEWRFKTWGYLLGNIDFTSFWIGHGLSSAAERMFQFTLTMPGDEFRVLEVHNDYLQLLYDFGVPGLIPYLMLIAILLRKGFGLLFRKLPESLRAMDITLMGLILVYCIFSATDNCFATLETPFWTMSALLLFAGHRLTQTGKGEKRTRDPASLQEH